MGIIYRGLLTAAILCVWTGAVDAQDDWMRVASDDGEFSIEVPRSHVYFTDEQGFSVSDGRGDLPLRKVEMLNAIVDGDLVSFERYAAEKRALERIYDLESSRKEVTDTNDVKRDTIKIRQLISKTDNYYVIRQYFATKDHVYVLTAMSRGGETPTMKRFLESLVVTARGDAKPADATAFSQLHSVTVEIDDQSKKPQAPPPVRQMLPAGTRPPTPIRDEKNAPVAMGIRPLAAYTNSARSARVEGIVALRITLSANGFFPKVAVVRTLPNGLFRQAFFAAMRIKFLPQLKDGQMIDATKTVEYSFDVH